VAGARVEAEFGAPADEVWTVVGDFGGFVELMGVVPVLDGTGVGQTRTIGAGDTAAVERLVEHDPATHRLSYALIRGPIPATDYVATMQLDDIESGRCRLVWSSTYEPLGAPADEVQQSIEKIYRSLIRKLQQRFGA
jgi:hypothetical protein